eukprot:TRINITY_DN48364_c0_g2_i1.p1 TRINITY_DN48364_c0_g2~~TRINITY_DN48364_c0_g2_i1.p1  ORF type:complete len:261 (-),score=-17.20 TRINITY_DN48364_c0_g2_i1:158-940(-)
MCSPQHNFQVECGFHPPCVEPGLCCGPARRCMAAPAASMHALFPSPTHPRKQIQASTSPSSPVYPFPPVPPMGERSGGLGPSPVHRHQVKCIAGFFSQLHGDTSPPAQSAVVVRQTMFIMELNSWGAFILMWKLCFPKQFWANIRVSSCLLLACTTRYTTRVLPSIQAVLMRFSFTSSAGRTEITIPTIASFFPSTTSAHVCVVSGYKDQRKWPVVSVFGNRSFLACLHEGVRSSKTDETLTVLRSCQTRLLGPSKEAVI